MVLDGLIGISIVLFVIAYLIAFVLRIFFYPSDESDSQPSDAKWNWSQVVMWIVVLALISLRIWYDISKVA